MMAFLLLVTYLLIIKMNLPKAPFLGWLSRDSFPALKNSRLEINQCGSKVQFLSLLEPLLSHLSSGSVPDPQSMFFLTTIKEVYVHNNYVIGDVTFNINERVLQFLLLSLKLRPLRL